MFPSFLNTITYHLELRSYVCGTCGWEISQTYAKWSCKTCDFDLCSDCKSAHIHDQRASTHWSDEKYERAELMAARLSVTVTPKRISNCGDEGIHVTSYDGMAPLWHHGTIAPRTPKKKQTTNLGKMP